MHWFGTRGADDRRLVRTCYDSGRSMEKGEEEWLVWVVGSLRRVSHFTVTQIVEGMVVIYSS